MSYFNGKKVLFSPRVHYGDGLIPEGTLEITENGTYEIIQYASVVVDVPDEITATDDGKGNVTLTLI